MFGIMELHTQLLYFLGVMHQHRKHQRKFLDFLQVCPHLLYINIKNEGLFAYSKRGKLRWNDLSVLNQFGYSQGCQKNVTNCYFTSSPIIDSCENSVYVCMFIIYCIYILTYCSVFRRYASAPLNFLHNKLK